jgi:hypothetical protein
MTLNQVCGRFREIVNSTSELWSRIRLTEDGPNYWSIESRFSEVNISLIKHLHIEITRYRSH